MLKPTDKNILANLFTVRKSSKLLFLSFSLVLLTTLLILTLVSHQIRVTQRQIDEIVTSNNKKSNLLFKMRQVARERSLSLYRMVSTKDVFEFEESFSDYRNYAQDFIKARNEFLSMALSPPEKELINSQGRLSQQAYPIQDSIIELIEKERYTYASETLINKALPVQDAVLKEITKLIELQNNKNDTLVNQLQVRLDNSVIIIIIMALLGIPIIFIIALYAIKRITETEEKLSFEKELAQITLHSIGDGVITVDKNYLIQSINPNAETLTNIKKEEAIGTNIFNVYEKNNNQKANINIKGDKIQRSLFDFSFTKDDGSKHEVEHTLSPIIEKDNSVLGAVIVIRDVTEMRNMEKKLTFQASHDALTNLINRREFEIRLRQSIRNAQSEKESHSICFLDLDRFKIINDTSGHAAGDEFLKQISKTIQNQLRSTDVLARLGGDEFGIILNNCSITKAKNICHAIIQSIRDARFIWGKNSFESGASIGIVPINELTTSISEIMGSVDAACYEAKSKGRNRIQVFEPNDAEFVRHKKVTSWIQKIKSAIKNDSFELYYQEIAAINPQYPTPKTIEILIRLNDKGKIIAPDSFIPAAERYNMMPLIDEWVVLNTFKFLNEYQQTIQQEIRVAINLSGQSLTEDSVLNLVTSQLRKNKSLTKEHICFEITETAAIANMSRATEFIAQMKQMGCRFSLDDFGSGLSSFTYLKNMPIDNIKIDGAFIRDIVSDKINKTFVESIHNIGKMMGIKTTAEYVENEDIFNCVKEIGIDYAQGYHIARPKPLKDLLKS